MRVDHRRARERDESWPSTRTREREESWPLTSMRQREESSMTCVREREESSLTQEREMTVRRRDGEIERRDGCRRKGEREEIWLSRRGREIGELVDMREREMRVHQCKGCKPNKDMRYLHVERKSKRI